MDINRLVERDLHKPVFCEKCGKAALEYKGVGEYKCSECGFTMYDDYGKVRNYLEENRGATQSQVSEATGVSVNTIRQLLRDDRLEVAQGSAVFLSCDICGSPIRSGRFCPSCLKKQMAAKPESSRKSNISGYGMASQDNKGSKRFTR